MTEQQRMVYVLGMAVQTMVEALGMLSENMQRIHRGESIAYDKNLFDELCLRNGMNHNTIISILEAR